MINRKTKIVTPIENQDMLSEIAVSKYSKFNRMANISLVNINPTIIPVPIEIKPEYRIS